MTVRRYPTPEPRHSLDTLSVIVVLEGVMLDKRDDLESS